MDLSDNGTLGFALNNSAFSNVCLPDLRFNHAIFAHWDDLTMSPDITDSSLGVLGVYKSVTGIIGSRVLNLEWRACRYDGQGRCGGNVNFEVRLYENDTMFDIVYGEVSNDGRSATIGAQGATGDQVTNYSCNSGTVQPGQRLRFSFGFSLLGTTATRTSTPTISPTNTPSSPTATPTCGPELRYDFTEQNNGAMIPCPNPIPDSHCHGCKIAPIILPFSFYLYGAMASWRAWAVCTAPGLLSQSLVLPSISVNRNVTVPVGRLIMELNASERYSPPAATAGGAW